MIVFQTCLVVLLSVVSSVVGQYRCNDFTISDCNLQSHVIFETDRIPSKEICQTTCHNYADCKLFFFLDGTCTLFDGDYRDECAVIGGNPLQSVDECVNGVDHGCDAFLGEQCVYEGQDFGLSPPNGQLNTALECEEFCVLYQDIGCQYWVFNATEMSCKILDSSNRNCRGFTGPAYPDYSECQGSTDTCPEGWMDAGGDFCYYLSLEKMNWYNSQEYCSGLGAKLAEFDSIEEEEAVHQGIPPENMYWIGLTDAGAEGIWLWASTSAETTYTNWEDYQPDDAGGNEDCVHFYSPNYQKNLRWNDYVCDRDAITSNDPIYALCQKMK